MAQLFDLCVPDKRFSQETLRGKYCLAPNRWGMLEGMSESPERSTEATAAAAEPRAAEPPSRWDRPHRPPRLVAVAAWVVIVGGIVFIVGAIFWTGVMLGALGGGHERRHGGYEGGGFRQSEMFEQSRPMGPLQRRGYDVPGGMMGPGGMMEPGEQSPSTSPAVPSQPTRP